MLTKEQADKIKKELSGNPPAGGDRMPIILGALGDPGRFRIFKLLMRHHDICVTDIANVLDITASAACQQLRVMEMLELVKKTRIGQMVCYELKRDNPAVKRLCKLFSAEGGPAPRLRRPALRRRLRQGEGFGGQGGRIKSN